MSQFSAGEAALEGFRLIRRHPRAVAIWCGVYFLGIAAIALVMAAILGPSFIAFIGAAQVEADGYEMFADELLRYWPAIFVVVALALFFIAVITNAMFRTLMSEAELPRAGVSVGRLEIRVAVVHLVLSSLFLCTMASLGGFVTAAFQLSGAGMLVSLGLAVLFAWLFVRLELALPATFAEGRIAFGRAWALSRKRFWPLMGMSIMALVFYLMAWLGLTVVNGAFLGLAALVQAGAQGAALAVLVVIVAIASTIIQLFSSVLQIVLPLAPTLVAYRAFSATDADHIDTAAVAAAEAASL